MTIVVVGRTISGQGRSLTLNYPTRHNTDIEVNNTNMTSKPLDKVLDQCKQKKKIFVVMTGERDEEDQEMIGFQLKSIESSLKTYKDCDISGISQERKQKMKTDGQKPLTIEICSIEKCRFQEKSKYSDLPSLDRNNQLKYYVFFPLSTDNLFQLVDHFVFVNNSLILSKSFLYETLD